MVGFVKKLWIFSYGCWNWCHIFWAYLREIGYGKLGVKPNFNLFNGFVEFNIMVFSVTYYIELCNALLFG